MDASDAVDALRRQALDLLNGPRWTAGSDTEKTVRELLPKLKEVREFQLLADLSERLVRAHPKESWLRKLQTQAMIEIGHASTAIEVARAGLKGLPQDDKEWSELNGLIGRAYKQIAMDAPDPTSTESVKALRQSVQAYAKPQQQNPENTWHAINLVAIAAFAQRVGIKAPLKGNQLDMARRIVETLEALPKEKWDRWTWATLAEASLALGKLDDVERYLNAYLFDPALKAFELGSTLRQFSEVWGLKDSVDARLSGLLQCMRVRLLQLPGAQMRLASADVSGETLQRAPDAAQLQAILGVEGTESYKWWKLGLDRANSVAAIYAGISQRIGTGFVVSAGAFGLPDKNERLVLTNFHVINSLGAAQALRPDDAQIAFEAIDPAQRYRIKEILWESSVEKHDACLMRVEDLAPAVVPIPLARNLPVLDATAKVYVIGHPGGGELEFSFQDNALLDHEGPAGGKPAIPDVCRLHYRAPTEKGSSGSPVFNAKYWELIALHHAGGVLAELNGKPGTHLANEGVSLISIVAAEAAARAKAVP